APGGPVHRAATRRGSDGGAGGAGRTRGGAAGDRRGGGERPGAGAGGPQAGRHGGARCPAGAARGACRAARGALEMLRFESTLAFRHLRSGGGQTLLTVSAVAAGVVVVIFITSLIFGLRQRISELMTDLLPHVTITPRELEPTPLARTPGGEPGGTIITSRIERISPQRKNIENWPQAVAVIRDLPHVAAIAPAVTGQGFLSRAARR